MIRAAFTAILVGIVVCSFAAKLDAAQTAQAEPLEGKEWQALGMVTGFRSIRLKKVGLEARLLEADGSASVAEDPVTLFLVVTNDGTSDGVERIWRVPRGVARVRGLAAEGCGVSVAVDVDRLSDARVTGTTPRRLRLCFLSREGTLETTLQVTEARP